MLRIGPSERNYCDSITCGKSSRAFGNLADLQACNIREHVVNDEWPMAAPDHLGLHSPITSNPYFSSDTQSANSLGMTDLHDVNYKRPYSDRPMTATQEYQYRCPCLKDNNAWHTLYPITGGIVYEFKQVGLPSSTNWRLRINKSSKYREVTGIPDSELLRSLMGLLVAPMSHERTAGLPQRGHQ